MKLLQQFFVSIAVNSGRLFSVISTNHFPPLQASSTPILRIRIWFNIDLTVQRNMEPVVLHLTGKQKSAEEEALLSSLKKKKL